MALNVTWLDKMFDLQTLKWCKRKDIMLLKRRKGINFLYRMEKWIQYDSPKYKKRHHCHILSKTAKLNINAKRRYSVLNKIYTWCGVLWDSSTRSHRYGRALPSTVVAFDISFARKTRVRCGTFFFCFCRMTTFDDHMLQNQFKYTWKHQIIFRFIDYSFIPVDSS